MKYALNLADDGRVLSASFYNEYSPEDAVAVDILPEGDVSEYKYVNGEYVHDPMPKPEQPEAQPSQLDIIEAQVTYTAMMTDTLLEV